jgi:hypothetical protein
MSAKVLLLVLLLLLPLPYFFLGEGFTTYTKKLDSATTTSTTHVIRTRTSLIDHDQSSAIYKVRK